MPGLTHDGAPPGGITRRQRLTGVALVTVLLALAAFLIGRGADVPPPDPIRTQDGAPVGVDHSPEGAVAAADDYLALEQASVERDPYRFGSLVDVDYAATLKASALAAALADRRGDRRGMRLWASGGESFNTVAAHRLDWYTDGRAQVTAWAGQIFWGPRQAPCQVWALARTALAWRGGRWRVTAMSTLPRAAPAPIELPQATPADTSTQAFYSELGGFSPVSYGSAR